jgi:spore coat polysaccharide biosynthesis protein SpsF
MGSSRLPGKVLTPMHGRPLLEHILVRLRDLATPGRVVVAVPDNPRDDELAEYCEAVGAACFRGSEHDVLARYLACAEAFGFEHIVRLTGDNPFVDVEELDRLIALHQDSRADFSHSLGDLPAGAGAEIFTLAALRCSELKGKAPHHREHVDEYILENPDLFRLSVLAVPAHKRRPDVRLTVDDRQDFETAEFILRNARRYPVSVDEAISLWDARPG